MSENLKLCQEAFEEYWRDRHGDNITITTGPRPGPLPCPARHSASSGPRLEAEAAFQAAWNRRSGEAEKRLQIEGEHPFPKGYDALDLANDRIKMLQGEVMTDQKQKPEQFEVPCRTGLNTDNIHGYSEIGLAALEIISAQLDYLIKMEQEKEEKWGINQRRNNV